MLRMGAYSHNGAPLEEYFTSTSSGLGEGQPPRRDVFDPRPYDPHRSPGRGLVGEGLIDNDHGSCLDPMKPSEFGVGMVGGDGVSSQMP